MISKMLNISNEGIWENKNYYSSILSEILYLSYNYTSKRFIKKIVYIQWFNFYYPINLKEYSSPNSEEV